MPRQHERRARLRTPNPARAPAPRRGCRAKACRPGCLRPFILPQNFIACDRGQTMLMPPDLSDWVPDDHVVWSILGAVDKMDLGAFYGAYRENGQGRAAYEPSMMVALLLYAYARGNRSSRGIERECREDVVYKR
jgi:hypothetical protein